MNIETTTYEDREPVRKKAFIRVNDIVNDLDISIPHAYKLMREMNEELKKKGYMTVSGRVSRKFYEEKFYGIVE